MTIENGQVASADEVMNAMGSLFNDTAQNIFNADYIGIDSRLAGGAGKQLKNVFYSTFQVDESTTITNLAYDSVNDNYTTDITKLTSGYSIYDGFNGPSLDGSKWSFSESGSGGLTVDGSLKIIADTFQPDTQNATVTGIEDIFANSDDLVKVTFSEFNATYNGSRTGTAYFELIGDTTTTLLIAHDPSGGGVSRDGTTVWIEKVGNTIYYYDDFNMSWGSIDITGWSSTPRLRFRLATSSSGGEASITTSAVEFLTNKNIHTYVSKDNPTTETVTNLIPVVNQDIHASNISVINSIAVDGSTFETVTLIEIHRPVVTGTQINNKIIITSDDTIANKDQISTINEEAIKYNLY